MDRLNAKQLRTTEPDIRMQRDMRKHPVWIILDNVLDTYNVGSIFRLADAVAVQKVILCGETLTPPNSRIKKASINTWRWVDWDYAPTALEAITNIQAKNEKVRVIAVEQDERSVPFFKAHYEFPLVLVVGNETHGVSRNVLNVADMIIELPMFGINKSLNVMVSCGIVLYEIMKKYST